MIKKKILEYHIRMIKHYLKKGMKINATKGDMFHALDNIQTNIQMIEDQL